MFTRIFSFLALMVSFQFAHAGPFVSGGMPGALKCSDAQGIYNIKVIYLGETVGLSGTRAVPTGFMPLSYSCTARYELLPAQPGSELLFVCDSNVNSDRIEFYRANGKASALLVSSTRNGVPDPTPLNCYGTNP